MTAALLIVGHGSRDAAANVEFEALVARYRSAHSAFEVTHGYVELAEPALATALRELAQRSKEIAVLPLFLFAAGHVKNDVPLALAQARREFPNVHFTALAPLGVHPNLVDLALERALAALATPRPPSPAPQPDAKSALVVVGRGSSDPDANADFCKVVRLLAESKHFGWVQPSFIGIAEPTLDAALELLGRSRPKDIVVLPYFLFSGRLLDKLRTQVDTFRSRYPWIRASVAEHLGCDARLLAILDERCAGVLPAAPQTRPALAARPLACDNCHYRLPMAGSSAQVGGLRALLWSLRHTFTHTQAMPHEHAHRPLSKHVLVCTNADCAERGSVPLLATLRRHIKDAGRERDIRVTRTHCMGRCGEGPTLAVYPDGIWYRGVRESDASELVREHLLADRLVSRLVDNIMQ